MAILKNTTISGTANLQITPNSTASRLGTTTTIIQWTNTGSQAYTVLAGTTPTLTNTSWTAPTGVTQVEVLVVAGGGPGNDGGGVGGGGGGAGGLIYNTAFTVSPGTSYTVTVGAGGIGATTRTVGGNSIFGSLTAVGGGVGGGSTGGSKNGGSGGGSGASSPTTTAGTGTPGQGFDGALVLGLATSATIGEYAGGGGGGAGGPGGFHGGGPGLNFSISGTATWYAGGGGGAKNTWQGPAFSGPPGNGGIGGGGNGGDRTAVSTFPAPTAGTASTGGGGGGSVNGGAGANGGSGIVIIKYTVTLTNTDPRGLLVYNSDSRQVEIFDNTVKAWSVKDTTRNFAGHNLLTYSEQFDNSAWAKTNITVSANSVQAPDGTLTADTITTSSTATSYIRYDTAAQGTGVIITVSAYVKSASSTTVTISDGYGTGANATFNLTTGAIVQSSDGGFGYSNPGIISVGNGWWRIWQTFKTQTSNNYPIGHRIDPGRTYGGTGSVGDSVYAWGAQVEQAYTPGPYTRVVSATSPVPGSIGGYRIHSFTTTGTSGFSPAQSGTVEVLVVAGGGGGGSRFAGGGGAGGLIYLNNYWVNAGQQYTVTVGAGGAGAAQNTGAAGTVNAASNGSNSIFGTLIAIGGGKGGSGDTNDQPVGHGGSGGGGTGRFATSGGVATAGQGFSGAGSSGTLIAGSDTYRGGGGGGAGGTGSISTNSNPYGGGGGVGLAYAISGTATYYAGGGGGGTGSGAGGEGTQTGAPGGLGGGGTGGNTTTNVGVAGTANTGGGGGGGVYNAGINYPGGAGGSGIVIVRYRYD